MNLGAKRIAVTLAAAVGGYMVASVVGFLIGVKQPFAVHWSGLGVALATFLLFSLVLGTFSKSADR
jgi:predicted benzoate:H+ symporter BenE